MYIDYYQSPIGTIEIRASDLGISSLSFRPVSQIVKSNHLIEKTIRQLKEYFNSKRTEFDIPLDMPGTDFQKQVWHKLQAVPFGQTCSYLDIAESLNNSNAVRAVGAANGRNPVSIIVPCHRVIGSDGKLTGYAGGLDRKQWLLEHEKAAVKSISKCQ